MNHILTATHLYKQYKKRDVVKNVSFTVHSQQIIGLLGPNGAGKTTSFHMLAGIIPCQSGRVKLDHIDITHYPIHQRARLGITYLPQEVSIFRKLSVEENIMAILELQKELSRQQRRDKMEALLGEFQLHDVRHNLGLHLSGGERRRVEIARALATEPKFILLDEPFSGIDPIAVMDIKRIINHLKKRGLGILITDHNVRETLSICQHAYIVSEGVVIAEGTPNSILKHQHVKQVYLGDTFDR